MGLGSDLLLAAEDGGFDGYVLGFGAGADAADVGVEPVFLAVDAVLEGLGLFGGPVVVERFAGSVQTERLLCPVQ